MTTNKTPVMTVATLLLAMAWPVRAEPLLRFTTQAGSKLSIEADSTVHGWQVESKTINGYFDAPAGFPNEAGNLRSGKVEARAEFSIPTSSLKNFGLDGRPGSRSADRAMHHLLRESVHPNIQYRLDELIPKPSSGSAPAMGEFEAKGTLVVAGATNQFTVPVRVTSLDHRQLKITGQLAVKLTDFGLKPVVIQDATTTGGRPAPDFEFVRDNFTFSFDWHVGREGSSAPDLAEPPSAH